MSDVPETDDALEQAARRLERATAMLEHRLGGGGGHMNGAGPAEAGGLFGDDRAKLAAELDTSRARERDLAEAGEQASIALGRAIAEIRAALAQTEVKDLAEEKGAA